ncbi:MAG: hypothetical protein ABS81_19700 [Pseudonocardia sp. SCN 72-86]|nr:MAG: hypothetical protein ABS81_19700 [Pseudonocardia sp. SCN 72-86]
MSERASETGTDDALTVLRGIWSATGQTSAELEERFGRRPGKVCKNMKNIGFGGMPGDPIDGDTNTPVDRLERDGKLHPRGRSVGESLELR